MQRIPLNQKILVIIKFYITKIGIIGTGVIGSTIAKKLVQAGHEVKVFSNGEQHLLEKRAAELGVKPAKGKYVSKIIKKISF